MALSDNLISYWSLEEASGTRADATATGNTLTDNNTVTGNTGKVANCGQFTAANSEYLSHTDNASLSTGDIDFTITCWCYFDTVTGGTGKSLVVKYLTTGNQREYGLFYNVTDHSPQNRFSFIVSSNGTATTVIDATTPSPAIVSTWYFAVAWHDSVNNQLGISINDTAFTSSYSSGVFDGTAQFNIGALNNGGLFYMDGRIDEIGLWKRVLSAAEITDLYNAGSGRDYAYITAAAGQPTMRRGGLVDYIAQPLELGRSNVRIF